MDPHLEKNYIFAPNRWIINLDLRLSIGSIGQSLIEHSVSIKKNETPSANSKGSHTGSNSQNLHDIANSLPLSLNLYEKLPL
jgi:hypothetical protein